MTHGAPRDATHITADGRSVGVDGIPLVDDGQPHAVIVEIARS
jgi:hypothetical protein